MSSSEPTKGFHPRTSEELLLVLLKQYPPEQARQIDKKWRKAGQYAAYNVGGKYSW